MKRTLILLIVVVGLRCFAQENKPLVTSDVLHVATAVDHLTVLQFAEPVVMAAAGSDAFQIERQENKVFVKPLKQGAATDLFIWTASGRFAYELEPAGEVKNMNFAIDTPGPSPKPVPDPEEQMARIADMMLTKAFLGAEHVSNVSIRDRKGRVVIRVEHVFQSKNSLYLHYSVRNLGVRPFRISTPSVQQLLPIQSAISLPSLTHTQLDQELSRKLGDAKHIGVAASNLEVQKEDLAPGQETQGVIAIRQQFAPATVLDIVVGHDRGEPVRATLVL
jgi:hypothetical protein